MTKQMLSIEQMQHLKELGLELKETMMRWQLANPQGKWVLVPSNMANLKVIGIPAYTLQDVLDALPDFINEYCLIIDMSFGVIRYDNLTRKNNPILKEKYFNDEGNTLIDVAYEMLCWCIEQGYINK